MLYLEKSDENLIASLVVQKLANRWQSLILLSKRGQYQGEDGFLRVNSSSGSYFLKILASVN